MAGFCTFCQTDYKKSKSNHEQKCTKFMFSVHQHPLSKTGPLIPIQRGPDSFIICKCLDKNNVVCNRPFSTNNSLLKHLREVQHDNWQVRTLYLFLCIQFLQSILDACCCCSPSHPRRPFCPRHPSRESNNPVNIPSTQIVHSLQDLPPP